MTTKHYDFSKPIAHISVIEIFEIGAGEACLQIVRDRGIFGWGNMRRMIAEQFEVDEDQINSKDVYWGGENHDADSVDAITIDSRIVATFGRAITHSEALVIAMTESNDVAYIAEGTI